MTRRFTKHLINDLENSVVEELKGFVKFNDQLLLIEDCTAVVRKDFKSHCDERKVIVISGGGAGHEPGQVGLVGKGCLTASITGDIFAAPPPGKICKLIKTIAKKDAKNPGIFMIVPNYTGDRLNFGLACERAILEGYKVDLYFFGDDCTYYGDDKRVGRRGLAGIMFANKIAGALAEEGQSLEQIKNFLLNIDKSIGTINLSLSACNIPGLGLSFSIGDDEMELGLGLHGEAGSNRLKISSAKQVIEIMLNQLFGPSSYLSKYFKQSDNKKIAVIINNLGGLSQFETNIIANEVVLQLEELNFVIERFYCGSFFTAFDMSGVSITVLAVDSNTLKLLDAPCNSFLWKQHISSTFRLNQSEVIIRSSNTEHVDFSSEFAPGFRKEIFLKAIKLACEQLIFSEKYLNELDREAGDGDTGSSLSGVAKILLKLYQDQKLSTSFLQLSNIVETKMCGTSGAIYSLLFTSASSYLKKFQLAHRFDTINYLEMWIGLLKNCIETITKYSLARPGDRSMIDALHSACQSLEDNFNRSLSYSEIAQEMAKASKEGAENTVSMPARVGRASYVNAERLIKPDAGAVAVSIWMNAIAETIADENF